MASSGCIIFDDEPKKDREAKIRENSPFPPDVHPLILADWLEEQPGRQKDAKHLRKKYKGMKV